MIEKPFLEIDDQIKALKSKGLTFKSEKKAANILKRHSYYEIINGYCDPFLDKREPKVYKNNASFEEIYSLYYFDFVIRNFMMKYLLKIEKAIKALTINAFYGDKDSKGNYLHTRDDYYRIESYDTSNKTKLKQTLQVINDLSKTIAYEMPDNKAFNHCISQYGYVPLWVIFTKLTFGETSKFYECLSSKEKSNVSKEFGLFQDDLTTMLKVLTIFRNVCAHGNRLYCFECTYELSQIRSAGNKIFPIETKAQKRFGAVLICLKYLLSPSDFKAVTNNLSNELADLFSKLKSINKQTVFDFLGITIQMITDFGIKDEVISASKYKHC